ncbi:MAG: GntR family transcriptional regulator [Burkholderiales bacterium]|nr:MAG: GntR family transcriptional regulator [Burkholderiales bacterium]
MGAAPGLLTLTAAPAVGVARWATLAGRWRERIVAGDWPSGAAIPPETELAREAGVALGTARQALSALVSDGLLERVHGRGTFVTRGLAQASMLRFFRFGPADLPDTPGATPVPHSRILARRPVRASTEQARRLGLADGARVLRVRRMRLIDGRPVLLETLWLPLPLFEPLAVLAPTDWDDLLYPMYSRRCRVTIVRAADELSFGALDAAQARALGLEAQAPAVRVEREAFDLAGRCVELRTTLGDARAFRYRAEIR